MTHYFNKTLFFSAFIVFSGLILSGCRQQPATLQVGTIQNDTLTGVPCCVYLPYGYAERVTKKQEVFPVLYLQHGMWGEEHDWTEKGNLIGIMDSLLRIGAVPEMIVIMPDNCPSRPTYEEEKADATSGEWENNFAQFMAEAEARYSISTEPSQRAIAGLSMGGYHTMRVASVLDGQFAYIGMFSPATFVHQAASAPTLLWIGIGNEDFLYDSLQEYRHWLEEHHYEYTYYESAGEHTWDNWQDYLIRFLPKCFR